MRQVCYICGILYGVKEPLDNDDETHGICDECFPWVMSSYKVQREEYDRKMGKRRPDGE